jgi:DNA-binding MarR family transcriptional regulator
MAAPQRFPQPGDAQLLPLPPDQVRVLWCLVRQWHYRGECNIHDAARTLGLSASYVHRLIKGLVLAGLVERWHPHGMGTRYRPLLTLEAEGTR